MIQCGFAFLLNFFDLTAPMLLFHMLAFNPAWIKPVLLSKNSILFYDGHCSLCHGCVRFMLAEAKVQQLKFSALQGKLFQESFIGKTREELPDSIVLIDGKQIFIKSDAVARLLISLGGFWRIVGTILYLIPKQIRDWGYSVIGSSRYKLFGSSTAVCPVLPKTLHERFYH